LPPGTTALWKHRDKGDFATVPTHGLEAGQFIISAGGESVQGLLKNKHHASWHAGWPGDAAQQNG
jgi:hypothetical protein